MTKVNSNSNKVTPALAILSVPVLILISGVFVTLDGFMFSYMWKWWVSGTFGVKELTIVQAIAISIIIQYFRNSHYEDIKKNYGKGLLNDFLLFGISWLLTLI